jgi:hypothetical protein
VTDGRGGFKGLGAGGIEVVRARVDVISAGVVAGVINWPVGLLLAPRACLELAKTKWV